MIGTIEFEFNCGGAARLCVGSSLYFDAWVGEQRKGELVIFLSNRIINRAHAEAGTRAIGRNQHRVETIDAEVIGRDQLIGCAHTGRIGPLPPQLGDACVGRYCVGIVVIIRYRYIGATGKIERIGDIGCRRIGGRGCHIVPAINQQLVVDR